MTDVAQERPVYFDGPHGHLAGVLTVAPHPNGRVVMLPWGGGAYPSSGKNRIRTNLARAVAEQGFHALRFDYHGVGESSGEYVVPTLGNAYTHEILSASRWLAAEGMERLVVVANCLGAYSTLMIEAQLPGLEAMAVVRSPIHRDHKQVAGANRTLREWAAAARRVQVASFTDSRRRATHRRMITAKARSLLRSDRSRGAKGSRFTRSVRSLLVRDIPVLMLYSVDDHFYDDLMAELDAGLRDELDHGGVTSRVVTTKETLQGFTTLASQDFVVDEVLRWLAELAELAELGER